MRMVSRGSLPSVVLGIALFLRVSGEYYYAPPQRRVVTQTCGLLKKLRESYWKRQPQVPVNPQAVQ
jgi:hypothetical protein